MRERGAPTQYACDERRRRRWLVPCAALVCGAGAAGATTEEGGGTPPGDRGCATADAPPPSRSFAGEPLLGARMAAAATLGLQGLGMPTDYLSLFTDKIAAYTV